MDKVFDVLVIGGGVIGLTAAIAMRQRGFSVAVIDAGTLSPDVDEKNTRVYALNQASIKLLNQLNLWPTIDDSHFAPYQHMHVWDATNGASIDFNSQIIGQNQLGVIIKETTIKQALLRQALSQNIELFSKTTITDAQSLPNGVVLRAKSKSWHAQLLIVADGAQSLSRRLLGAKMTSWPYHQQAIVATVETTLEHQHTAWQVFNVDGPLAFLPLTDQHQCSIVWSTSTQHAEYLMTLSDDDFSNQLTQAFAEKLGPCRMISPRSQFPLIMSHTQHYSGSNWLLMGDAAHTIHPLAGQGLNLGFADISCWLSHLDQRKRNSTYKTSLGAYQRQRKHAVWQMIALMGGLKTLFGNPLPPIATLRGWGLQACNHLSLIKRFLIEQAAG